MFCMKECSKSYFEKDGQMYDFLIIFLISVFEVYAYFEICYNCTIFYIYINCAKYKCVWFNYILCYGDKMSPQRW